jgi:tripartite ATP-independent transporter DctM subunit|tara:strand:- start:345 stop:1637 length:1293 start_codon:yes stop_codon:yes gene_type:complete
MLVSLIGFAILLLICFAGFPLGWAMVVVGFGGFAFVRGIDPALGTVGQLLLDFSMNYHFSTLPLFILMGTFVYRAALAEDMYDAAYAWLGHFRGGLAMATVAACGGFAAVSGSSAATAATMAKVALPSMRRFNYDDRLAAGSVAAGGTIGILIPPSIALIIYGILVEEDIGKLFIAGILPGILTIILYIVAIRLVTMFRSDWGPPGARTEWIERFKALGKVWGIVLLFIFILGGIYAGVFTPSEAGGIGAAGALIFAMARRKLPLDEFFKSLVEAGKTTVFVFTVAYGAIIFSNFINIAGMPDDILEFVNTLNVPPMGVIFAILVIYVLLGAVFEGIGMILLTVPIFFPVVQSLGFDLIWFGIVVIMVTEISLITPPVGMNVFVLKTMLPDVSLWTIFRGIGPFFCADLVRLALVVFFPAIALWLPSFMK